MAKLSSIAYYVTDKISSNDISLAEYVTTDCILQNKKGREVATNLPPQLLIPDDSQPPIPVIVGHLS